MREDLPRPQTGLFSYGTDISLRGPDRRSRRMPLLVMLVITAAAAALMLMGVLWLATADLAAVTASLRDLLASIVPRI